MRRPLFTGRRLLPMLAGTLAFLALAPASALASGGPFEAFSGTSFLATLTTQSVVGSTVPPNGDLNPYGIVNVTRSEGALVAGDTLVSNFNNKENLQGTGSTVVQLSPTGELSVFAQIEPSKVPGCPGGVGLTTALTILPGGYVVVGSLPTTEGTPATAHAGCLIVLDNTGHPVKTISGLPINGPWDMTAVTGPVYSKLFVTNVLNGTVASGETPVNGGTVVRIELLTCCGHAPVVTSERVIATGFAERTDKVGFVRGPTGLAFEGLPGFGGLLFVTDTVRSRIALVVELPGGAILFGHNGLTISQGGHLGEPVGMTLAPNGHVLTTNSVDGNIVESTLAGKQFTYNTHVTPDELFGLTLTPDRHGVLFVNDNANNVELAHR